MFVEKKSVVSVEISAVKLLKVVTKPSLASRVCVEVKREFIFTAVRLFTFIELTVKVENVDKYDAPPPITVSGSPRAA